jgi:outer membrane receptor for ferrienterochelin and colicin
MCKLQTDRICKELENDDNTVSDLKFFLAELHNRVLDECSTRYYLALSDEEKGLFEPQRPLFGADIEDKIPSVIEDIAEAGKCLGLGRSTAAVFHLMRVMETGVQRLGQSLGVELTEAKVWQVILDQINKKIKEQHKQAQRYASIAAHLYNVKLAWRNEAMHPKATYTVEEAQGIFDAVKVFMNDLTKVI